MSRPKLLDLCGCEGGGSAGYAKTHDVYVIDMDANRLKYNPYPSAHMDALLALRILIGGGRIAITHKDGTVEWLGLADFAAIHVSPPCQYYSRGNAQAIKAARAANGGELPESVSGWPRLIPAFRELLEQTGLPYIIENVTDAAWDMHNPILLCGCMFDLSIRDYTCTSPGEHIGTCDTVRGVVVHLERGRLFETNWDLTAPRRCEGEGQPRNNHPSHDWVAGAYGGSRRDKYEARYIRKGGYVPPDTRLVKALLGVEHEMTQRGLFECLPPAYTEWIGLQLAAHINEERAA